MLLDPANAGRALRLKLTVMLFPATTADEVAPLSTHWLFSTVPTAPKVIGASQPFPASLTRNNWLVAWWYRAAQAPDHERTPLINTVASLIAPAPCTSE